MNNRQWGIRVGAEGGEEGGREQVKKEREREERVKGKLKSSMLLLISHGVARPEQKLVSSESDNRYSHGSE